MAGLSSYQLGYSATMITRTPVQLSSLLPGFLQEVVLELSPKEQGIMTSRGCESLRCEDLKEYIEKGGNPAKRTTEDT